MWITPAWFIYSSLQQEKALLRVVLSLFIIIFFFLFTRLYCKFPNIFPDFFFLLSLLLVLKKKKEGGEVKEEKRICIFCRNFFMTRHMAKKKREKGKRRTETNTDNKHGRGKGWKGEKRELYGPSRDESRNLKRERVKEKKETNVKLIRRALRFFPPPPTLITGSSIAMAQEINLPKYF